MFPNFIDFTFLLFETNSITASAPANSEITCRQAPQGVMNVVSSDAMATAMIFRLPANAI